MESDFNKKDLHLYPKKKLDFFEEVFFMDKYPFELRLKMICDYLDGKGGSDYMPKKYSVKALSQVKHLINIYQEFGEESLVRKCQNKKYSVQFKLNKIRVISNK